MWGMRPQEIADRLEIGDVLARYTHAIDTGDWGRLDLVFTPDAVIDYTAGGIKGTRDEVRAWLAEVLSQWPGRQHLIGTTAVRFEGRRPWSRPPSPTRWRRPGRWSPPTRPDSSGAAAGTTTA
nr:hypothetical protein GCM10020093_003160 [Planobispora longispora]